MARIQKKENDLYKELDKYFVMPEDQDAKKAREKALGQDKKEPGNKNKK
ncbi:hypothetical protein ACKP2L_04165 [Oenococcus alcoholitolerans]